MKIKCNNCGKVASFKVPLYGYIVRCTWCDFIITNLYDIKLFRVFNFMFVVLLVYLALLGCSYLKEILSWPIVLIYVIVVPTIIIIFRPIHTALSYCIYKATNK